MSNKSPRSNSLCRWPGHDSILLKVKDVAELLGVHTNTIYNWVADGEMECVRLPGNKITFTYDQVQDFINNRRDRATGNWSGLNAA